MKIGRNQPCPCGSGVKYKKCCYKLADFRDESKPAPPKGQTPGDRKAAQTALLVAQMLSMRGGR